MTRIFVTPALLLLFVAGMAIGRAQRPPNFQLPTPNSKLPPSGDRPESDCVGGMRAVCSRA